MSKVDEGGSDAAAAPAAAGCCNGASSLPSWCKLKPRFYFPALAFTSWLALGLIMYMCYPWSKSQHYYTFGEALYLMVQILTTIGYGDRPGPHQPRGYLFSTCYVIVGVIACANLVTLLVDRVRNSVSIVHNNAVGRISQTASRVLTQHSRLEMHPSEFLKNIVPASIYEPIRHRWTDVKNLVSAIAWLSFFLAVGTIFFANWCEHCTCVAGHCCKSWVAREHEQCESIRAVACVVRHSGANATATECVKRSDGRFHCQAEDGSWIRCRSPYRAQEDAFRKFWTPAWPGQSSHWAVEIPECSETTATCCEGKSYLEAFYMSVVTLTTVGFGDVTPTTHGGIWFCIPWMLFGVASFANLVAAASILMMGATQRLLSNDLLDELRQDSVIESCRNDRETMGNIPEQSILRAEFILHALIQDGLVSMDVVNQLSEDFSTCDKDGSGFLDEHDLTALSAQATSSGGPPETAGLLNS